MVLSLWMARLAFWFAQVHTRTATELHNAITAVAAKSIYKLKIFTHDTWIDRLTHWMGKSGKVVKVWGGGMVKCRLCGKLWERANWLTIGILCLEAISLDYHRREYDYLWFILGGGVQQAIMTIRIDTEGALCVQIHFVLVMCKLCSVFRFGGRHMCHAKLRIRHGECKYYTHLI